MKNDSIKVGGIEFTRAAAENIQETGCDPADDVDALRSGEHTRESLLAHCLDGADENRIQGWHDYVDAIADAAEWHPEESSRE